ncbi:MAG: chorismate mutase, partial [Hyphomonadaceae bacterium]
MTDASPPGGDPLEPFRREIDRIDRSMLDLMAERLQLVDRIAEAKTQTAGLPIRPGREIALLRSLIASAQAPLERELIVEVWRALIAAALRRQRVIDVVVGGGRTDPTRLYDIARRHFGARTRVQNVPDPQTALQRAAEKPDACVAVTPWPGAPGVGAWWPALTESRFHKLHLIAGLPLLGSGEEPEAAVFAASPNEKAGGDISLVLAEDPHHRLQ